MLHPRDVLYQGARPLPALPACEHYAGSEKLIRKALTLQQQMGPVFDVTCDCEDGAPAGRERAHAEMVAQLIAGADNRFGRVGLRVHDITHPHWREDLEIVVPGAGSRLAYVTFPKVGGRQDAQTMIMALRAIEKRSGLARSIPVHVLIESHGALREVFDIAALPGVEVLDFGLMDFVSAHHGAIPASAMKSPGQFEHPLVVRAKCEIAAAALAHAVIPSHNVTTELRDTSVVLDDARTARFKFGYLRMWSIHPAQIQPIVEAMRPALDEVAEAAEILVAAQDADWGPIQHGGRLHDRASYRYYWELLQRAKNTGASLPDAAGARFFS